MDGSRSIRSDWCGGLTGISFISERHIKLEDPETLFIVMSQILFHPLVGGFLLAAILAAIMSTISSQLLVTSSSLTEDFYKLIRGSDKASSHQKEFVLIGRLSVLLVAIVAITIAWHPNDTILNLVGNACATIVVARWDKALDKDLLDKALKNPKAE